MAENKKQSGYAILKAKLVKKDQEIESLKNSVSALTNTVSSERNKVNILSADLLKEQETSKQLRDMYVKAVNHMGWLRRLIYGY